MDKIENSNDLCCQNGKMWKSLAFVVGLMCCIITAGT